ncbi:hypothetical protein NDU88_007786 [Pleurodeles waltl]|uniref:Uncharacterized protein n=1 Tax=Pleurodeles waltl TaxID=8319 RepID=A0AAV7NCE7_PLEWA|nr:hypothetical protein NDU88_007786 [Pleurodeles waltl]
MALDQVGRCPPLLPPVPPTGPATAFARVLVPACKFPGAPFVCTSSGFPDAWLNLPVSPASRGPPSTGPLLRGPARSSHWILRLYYRAMGTAILCRTGSAALTLCAPGARRGPPHAPRGWQAVSLLLGVLWPC